MDDRALAPGPARDGVGVLVRWNLDRREPSYTLGWTDAPPHESVLQTASPVHPLLVLDVEERLVLLAEGQPDGRDELVLLAGAQEVLRRDGLRFGDSRQRSPIQIHAATAVPLPE